MLKLRLFVPSLQVEGGQQLYTCALRPTGIYGEGHELMKSFYKEAVKRGGVVIGGVPPNSEHGRVYAGDPTTPLPLHCGEGGSHCLSL